MTTQLIQSDITQYLAGNQWLVQRGHIEKYQAVLCDPPYFLGSIVKRFGSENAAPAQYGSDGVYQRSSKGFMGQTWDGFDSPQSYQEWVTEWASLMLDFMHPGAVGLFFGGTRTYHRLVCGLENAGWEIYDSIISWTYGCISEDTEILTEDGWEFYSPDILNKRILCYNKDMDVWQWEKPYHVSKYNYADTAYRIQSNTTDQLVSRNHRCLIEREGELLFQFAEHAARESEIRVPVLEDVRWLQQAVFDTQQYAGATEQILPRVSSKKRTLERPGMVSEAGNIQTNKETKRRTRLHAGQLPGLRQGILQAECLGQACQAPPMQRQMQEHIIRKLTGAQSAIDASLWVRSCRLDGEISRLIPDQNDGREQPGMEGGVTYRKRCGNYGNQRIKYVRCPQTYISMARKDDYVMEHRLLVAQAMGRVLTRTETVHHINHNAEDNRLQNLMLFRNNQEHKLYEGRGNPQPIWQGLPPSTTKA